MEKYIGVKLIEASPMNRGDYNELRGWTVPVDENPADDGYLVVYPDGYKSWSPKDQFERAYFGLSGDPQKSAPAITQDDIRRFMHGQALHRVSDKAATVTSGTLTGFEMHHTAACVSPENYDEKIASEIGQKNNSDKLWGHLGFVLQWALNGVNPGKP